MSKTSTDAPKQGFIGGILVGIGTKIVANRVEKALDKAMNKVESSPSIPVNTKEDSAAIKAITQKEVMKEVGPIIENLQNEEPLWRSKVLWSAFGTFALSVSAVVKMWSDGVPDDPTEYVLAASAAVGALGTIFARIFPSKALGR